MTTEAADWVYGVVLTRRYKESAGAIMWTGARENRRDGGAGAAFLRSCPCEVRLCGRCGDGRPDRCAHRSWSPGPTPATFVQDHRGMAVAEVWRAGTACSWVCATARAERALSRPGHSEGPAG
ncbi:MAG: DUF6248 family natural product biosynthesis protein, partial [Microthrixaceae bacterium]